MSSRCRTYAWRRATRFIRNLTQGQLARTLDAANEPRLTALGLNDVAGFQSLILTPLVVQDHIAGLLIFGHTAPGAFTGANEPALLATANMAASVLYNAILFDRVHNESSEREAILRLIADGVVVCDQKRNIMLRTAPPSRCSTCTTGISCGATGTRSP